MAPPEKKEMSVLLEEVFQALLVLQDQEEQMESQDILEDKETKEGMG